MPPAYFLSSTTVAKQAQLLLYNNNRRATSWQAIKLDSFVEYYGLLHQQYSNILKYIIWLCLILLYAIKLQQLENSNALTYDTCIQQNLTLFYGTSIIWEFWLSSLNKKKHDNQAQYVNHYHKVQNDMYSPLNLQSFYKMKFNNQQWYTQ